MQSNLPVLPVAVLESLYEHLPPYSSDMAEQYNTNNHNSSICLREGIWAHETSLTPPLLIQEINEIVPSQDNEWL